MGPHTAGGVAFSKVYLTSASSAKGYGYDLALSNSAGLVWAVTSTSQTTTVKLTVVPSAIPGSDLTRVNDTNVTITLTGTPAAALLQPVTVTAGWTGTLAVSRGGTGAGSFAANQVLYGNDASALSSAAGFTFDGTHTVTITGTAPTLVMTDTTGSAESLTHQVDANSATWARSSASSTALLRLSLSGTNRLTVGNSTMTNACDFGVVATGNNVIGLFEARRSGSTYYASGLVLSAPRSDTADGATTYGRGMLSVDGQSGTVAGTVTLAAQTASLTPGTTPTQSWLTLTGSSGSTSANNTLIFQTGGFGTVLKAQGDGNIAIGGAGSFGSGTLVVFLANRTAAPSSNPTGGGILYAESGALKWRGSGGTTTTIANA